MEKQPAGREFEQLVAVKRQFEQPVERQLAERQPRQQEMELKLKQLKRILYKENGSEQSLTMESEFDLSEHFEATNEEAGLLELEHKALEVVWAPMLELLQLQRNQNHQKRACGNPKWQQLKLSWLLQELMVNLCSAEALNISLSINVYDGANVKREIGVT